MPEGPEIRRAVDKIANAVEGQRTVHVGFGQERLAHYGPLLTGLRVVSVQPRGKAVVTFFEDNFAVYSHNQLYGRWTIVGADKDPASTRQLRFEIRTQKKRALLYSASEIDVLEHAAVDFHPYIQKLGPDPLAVDASVDAILRHLDDKRFSNRPLGTLLLDQAFVAGIGNYLRSEVLFLAELGPHQKLKDLSMPQKRTLARHLFEVPRQSYETGGVTNDLERVAAMKERGLSRRAYRHHVFGRSGQRCYRCGEKIVREEAAGRRVYICSGCQPLAD